MSDKGSKYVNDFNGWILLFKFIKFISKLTYKVIKFLVLGSKDGIKSYVKIMFNKKNKTLDKIIKIIITAFLASLALGTFSNFSNYTEKNILITLIDLIVLSTFGTISNVINNKKEKKQNEKIEQQKEEIKFNNEMIESLYKEDFESIRFKDGTGKTPFLIAEYQDKKDNRFEYKKFKSNLTLLKWRMSTKELEMIFNNDILSIKEDPNNRSIKIVKLGRITEINYVELNNDYLNAERAFDKVVIGIKKDGSLLGLDFNSVPHTLISGDVGSGKSVLLYSLYVQLKLKDHKIFLCDFKCGNAFSKFLPYQKGKKVITKKEEFLNILEWVYKENARRMELIGSKECEDLKEYNSSTKIKMHRIFIFVDELARITKIENDKEVSRIKYILEELGQLSRSQGIHLVLSVQRPSVKSVPSELRAVLGNRICGKFNDKGTSEMAIQTDDAIRLPEVRGRMLCRKGDELHEVQTFFTNKEMLDKYLQKFKSK